MKYKIERWEEMYPLDAENLREALTAEGYFVYQWQDAPKTFYPNHQHSSDQTHWVISGVLELTIEKLGTFTLEAGDRDFMPAETIHSARVVGNEAVIYLIGEKIK